MNTTKPDTLETSSDVEYAPYQDNTQSARYIQRYPRSFTRNPSQPLIERPLTLSELSGPLALDQRLGISREDIARPTPNGPRAIGQYIEVTGRVVDEDGAPLAGSMIEIWQANSAGKYIHEMDRHEAPVDPNFIEMISAIRSISLSRRPASTMLSHNCPCSRLWRKLRSKRNTGTS